jgi:hypothetical protein
LAYDQCTDDDDELDDDELLEDYLNSDDNDFSKKIQPKTIARVNESSTVDHYNSRGNNNTGNSILKYEAPQNRSNMKIDKLKRMSANNKSNSSFENGEKTSDEEDI